jgi:hypothetical protein
MVVDVGPAATTLNALGALGFPSGTAAGVGRGDMLYLAAGPYLFSTGLVVVDIADTAHPVTTQYLPTGVYGSLALSSRHLIAGDNAASVVRRYELGIDGTVTGEAAAPALTPAAGPRAASVQSIGGVEYLLQALGDSVAIVDLDQEPPVKIATVGPFAQVVDLAFDPQANHLFVSRGDRVSIFNLSNPASPVPLGSCGMGVGETAVGVAYLQNRLYVAMFSDGMKSVDITNRAAPACTSKTVPVVGWSRRVLATERYLFVADDIWGLTVIDAADPQNPRLVHTEYDIHHLETDRGTWVSLDGATGRIMFGGEGGVFVFGY